MTAAMRVCGELKAAGVVTVCEPRSFGAGSAAVFRTTAGGGVVTVFDELETFEGVLLTQTTERGEQKVAAARVARTLVRWTGDSPSADRAIRSVVEDLEKRMWQ